MNKTWQKPRKQNWSGLNRKPVPADPAEPFYQFSYYYCNLGMVAINEDRYKIQARIKERTEFVTIHQGRSYRMTIAETGLHERSLMRHANTFLKQVIGGETMWLELIK